MTSLLTEAAVSVALFGAILVLGVAGRAAGARRPAEKAESHPAHRAVEAAVLGLFGLLLAFSFSGAAQRYDGRKVLIREEVNAIGTAYLRLDLLPEEDRRVVQPLLLRYLDSRVETYRRLPDLDAAMKEVSRSEALQGKIWSRCAAVARREPGPLAMVLLPALNAMFDIRTTRIAATRIHTPFVVYLLLIGVALASSLLLGYALADSPSSGWLHLVIFAAAVTLTIFVVRDLEYPRLGLIRLDEADQLLVDLRRSLAATPLEP